jgi:tetratricopeptide (TPR) repeat protein
VASLLLLGAVSGPDPLVAFQAALDSRARGGLVEAEAQLQEICRGSPGWALPWIELGEVQLARGATEQARASLAQAAVLDSVNPRVYHDRALAEQAEGRLDLAEKDELFAVQLRPEYAEALANLAELRWQAGRQVEALAILEGLSARHPEQTAYAVRLIDAYSALGRQVAAERELRALVARDPQNPVWHRKLARLLAAQGLMEEAAREGALADSAGKPVPRQLRRLPKSKK